MANWLVLSIIVIMAILFMVFVLPQFAGTPSEKKMSLQEFCNQFSLDARQHIFQGIMQCYKTTKNGNSVTETACDVAQTNGQFEFKGDCPLVPAPPAVKLPDGQVR